MTTMTTETNPHANLGYAERGTRTMLGDLGHWHMLPTGKRSWVRGTVEACETGLSDEDLIAKIREADETFDPAPEFGAPRVTNIREDIVTAVRLVKSEGLVVTKPERGGKRICGCNHSESRHNASGPCRTCECTDFAIPA